MVGTFYYAFCTFLKLDQVVLGMSDPCTGQVWPLARVTKVTKVARVMRITRVYWAVVGSCRLYWTVVSCTGMFWAELGCSGLY